METMKLLLDGCNGVHIPRYFSQTQYMTDFYLDRVPTVSFMQAMNELSDPNNEFYWEVWDEILSKGYWVDSDGNRWTLWQDGDLWMVRDDHEWEN